MAATNILLDPELIQSLYDEPSLVALYQVESIVPDSIVMSRMSWRLAPTTNAATLSLLARVHLAGVKALGFLQLARPQDTVQAKLGISTLKSSMMATGNFLNAKAGHPAMVPDALDVAFSDDAFAALTRIEQYDPALIHLSYTTDQDGIRYVYARGSLAQYIRTENGKNYYVTGMGEYKGIDEDDDDLDKNFTTDPIGNYKSVLAGLSFPLGLVYVQ